MKKGVCVFLAAILLLGVVGCTTSKQETSSSNVASQTSNHVTSQIASRTESGGEQILSSKPASNTESAQQIQGNTSHSASKAESKQSVSSDRGASQTASKGGQTMSADFAFDGAISQQVLKNYLSRSITYSFFDASIAGVDADIEAMVDMGAKYIARSTIVWITGGFELSRAANYKRQIEKAHRLDPDIVFEACLFETTAKSVEEIPIPEHVFRAFGLKPEKRNFSYEKMLYPDGRYVNHWGTNQSVPDITQLETQMFQYWHATFYIDAGFEGLHWGQVHLMGERDTNFAAWTKVINLTRAYAKTHARRKFVLNDAHTHGIIGADGLLLFDFHAWPTRMITPAGASPHPATEENPQEIVIKQGALDAIYGKSLGGTTHSGWSCKSLPYVVELDNYGGIQSSSTVNVPGINYWPWGFDEISWFANQPQQYRKSFIEFAYKRVRALDENGFFGMVGSRPATYYYISSNTTASNWYYALASDDTATIKEVWSKYAAKIG